MKLCLQLFVLVVCSLFLGIQAKTKDDSSIWSRPKNKDDQIWYEDWNGGGLDKNPGLKVRIPQTIVDLIRQNLVEYGAAYLNYDYDYKK